MSGKAHGPVTQLLRAAGSGDGRAREKLWSLIYDELHRLAQAQLAGDAVRRDVQPTTLVHEAYLRLVGEDHVTWNDRRHFFGAAAQAMRRIRIDEARRRRRLKRGAGQRPDALVEDAAALDADPLMELAVDEALRKLEQQDPRKAEIVSLRFFAGLSIDEAAKILDLSPRTVDVEWRFARAWLYRELRTGGTRADDGK